MGETCTNIYLPSPWFKLTQPYQNCAEVESVIHVTGHTTDNVQKATHLIKNILDAKVIKKYLSHHNNTHI
jgi:hypothetical protein